MSLGIGPLSTHVQAASSAEASIACAFSVEQMGSLPFAEEPLNRAPGALRWLFVGHTATKMLVPDCLTRTR